ncbi:patatin-like phospholipase family protein [Reinekea marinisedimentorum]|uniref:NTE family protein n=1 Tax=Reinekea marinisedimentorum TaxID=230495 RepID=A0A4R3I6J6_9GAMM|nr:patatin-like phospholipase family protein [Reinekea marinisedimentorum]TCS41313.1 NTE family protein [Reinekea marinisedimentorum]
MNADKPYCLVLGGGGAKGVYHIGVWQALQELQIPVNAFIGNSIGAIISAFLSQGAEEELLHIARSINIKSLIRLSKEEALTDEESMNRHPLKYWQAAYNNFVERKGLDTSPMRELLEGALNEEQIRNSGFDFGITTVNVSDFKPREVFIEDMEQGQLVNYVMASAAFPGFERPKIQGKQYVDGGLYDNVPYRMARRRGYRRIILVDISGIGFSRRPRTEGSQTVYIKNSIDMGNAFDFTPDFIHLFWQLGYLDAMRVFDELIGYEYFLTKNDALEKEFAGRQELRAQMTPLLTLFPDAMRHDQRHLLKTLEVCGRMLRVERIKKYAYGELARAIDRAIDKTRSKANKFIAEHGLEAELPPLKLLDAFTQEVIQNKTLDENPYYYYFLAQKFPATKAVLLAQKYLLKATPELKILDFYMKNVAGKL